MKNRLFVPGTTNKLGQSSGRTPAVEQLLIHRSDSLIRRWMRKTGSITIIETSSRKLFRGDGHSWASEVWEFEHHRARAELSGGKTAAHSQSRLAHLTLRRWMRLLHYGQSSKRSHGSSFGVSERSTTMRRNPFYMPKPKRLAPSLKPKTTQAKGRRRGCEARQVPKTKTTNNALPPHT